MVKTQIDQCRYMNEQGIYINTCRDKPVITYCKRCNCFYAIDQHTGARTELCLTWRELLDFIKEKEDSAEEND